MSLLLPDYSSSSSDDEAGASVSLPPKPSVPSAPSPVAPSATATPAVAPKPPLSTKPAKKKKKSSKKKAKAAVFLPPEIQRLLESGGGGAYSSDSDDGGSELLAKRKQARRAAAASKRPRVAGKTEADAPHSAALSFLPPPKHEEEAEEKQSTATEESATHDTAQSEPTSEQELAQQQAAYAQQQAAYAQYYAQQQQAYAYAGDYSGYDYGQEVEASSGSSSKRARLRDRELERALQQGQFHEGVLGKIAEVTGPAPNAWQPPAEATAAQPADGELKVKASFWSTQQGARVATAKPNRLQRQKHQLNQLAFDAKAHEFELLDRKGSALKTKSETYAKYGW
jgi:hypothetical protein